MALFALAVMKARLTHRFVTGQTVVRARDLPLQCRTRSDSFVVTDVAVRVVGDFVRQLGRGGFAGIGD